MQLYWGVRPYKSIEFHTTEDILSGAIDLLSAKQWWRREMLSFLRQESLRQVLKQKKKA